MNPYLLWILTLMFALPNLAFAKVRKVEVNKDQVVTVRTAVGIATIVQVPDRPNSIVVGDQSAFKVEYLDQAITIKPLHGGAKSNLYIYTDYRRFNVQLVTGSEESSDYVVYLENPKEKEPKSTLRWMTFKSRLKNDAIAFEVKRLGRTRDGVLIVEFEITSERKEKLGPEWIWVTQNGVSRPIHNLILSGLALQPNQSVRGMIQILRADISETEPLKIELRNRKTSFLTIPKVAAWK